MLHEQALHEPKGSFPPYLGKSFKSAQALKRQKEAKAVFDLSNLTIAFSKRHQQ